ncbi:hypothetical protein BCR35DRAFT_356059 [Leucosporidium creatinivorum]|uniref:Uncharacterized protein n=1 Tax=Leucosporidium creatinivorum TaxID=106004 RepID=A0A1Y2CXJ6_9BASI|nr:hypothetical protein BCR35DRAFT_356059 [Leucosporidium creatinivorum]
MSRSEVVLFYGVWVKTWQLAFAADAHENIAPLILAIDLISFRRRWGKLQVEEQETKTTALGLPEEVWELVKQEIIDGAIEEAEQDAVRRNRCPSCRYALGERNAEEMKRYPEILTNRVDLSTIWRTWEEFTSCEWCWEIVVNESDYSHLTRNHSTAQRVKRLLNHYDLCMPSSEMLEQEECYDFDALSPVSIPLRLAPIPPYWSSDPQDIVVDAIARFHTPTSLSQVFAVSPEALEIPSDAASRFRRLSTTYRLQIVAPQAEGVIEALSSEETSSSGQGRDGEQTGGRSPSWVLWSRADSW